MEDFVLMMDQVNAGGAVEQEKVYTVADFGWEGEEWELGLLLVFGGRREVGGFEFLEEFPHDRDRPSSRLLFSKLLLSSWKEILGSSSSQRTLCRFVSALFHAGSTG